jgi:hypothetical protein
MKKLIAIAFVVTVAALPRPAAAYTASDQAACQDDAFRVCSHAIPDERRVKACLISNMRRLSPQCRRVFQRSRRGEMSSPMAVN